MNHGLTGSGRGRRAGDARRILAGFQRLWERVTRLERSADRFVDLTGTLGRRVLGMTGKKDARSGGRVG